MGKGRRRGRGKKEADPDADLEGDVDYQVSDSEDELGDEGRIMLDRARQGRYIRDEEEEEVLKVFSSSDEDEDEEGEEGEGEDYYGGGVGSDMDSDLEKPEEGDGLPSDKAWGRNKKAFYNTDYVDKDYGGLGKDEEEAALMEETEADAVQRRLLAQLEDTDFTLGLLDKVEKKKASDAAKRGELVGEAEKIQTDLSKLTTVEKINFLKQNSPEFFPLIEDFKKRMEFAQKHLVPILDLVKKKKFPKCKATNAVHTYYCLILNYCTNIVYYLVVKQGQARMGEEPVLGRLAQWQKLLQEMDAVWEERLYVQLARGDLTDREPLAEPSPTDNRKERRKKRLRLLEEKAAMEAAFEEKKRKLEEAEEGADLGADLKKTVRFQEESSASDQDDVAEEVGEEKGGEEAEKRGITYKMAKNKGLTPRKKKELRNPRVKHRNKFRKAKIRRKGQVREVRNEIQKYGGEISGIKAYSSKSIKIA